ncbi:NYN domain-containing protein [Desulfocurvus vexinensis]|uniref:NYN domain-containing protein n=1 Tax=Desulfocurvus vexinensis TaxID=399548 RepID=UPI00048FCEF2|nr:NYN domain-containing protein [Desulfocurvus vexinensis]
MKLAVLIDADNAQATKVGALLDEIALYGVASVKRAYGDWTTPNLKGWKDVLHEFAIQPVQQFAYTQGKNSTDAAMIIDAMDLLHAGTFDGFCIVSSDSDYTRLATRIREQGLTVYGFGEKKTPKPFVQACDKFVYTEILNKEGQIGPGDAIARPLDFADKRGLDKQLIGVLKAAVAGRSNDDGWSHLAPVGDQLAKTMPDFDPRNYGYSKLSQLFSALKAFELRVEGEAARQQMYVRIKPE